MRRSLLLVKHEGQAYVRDLAKCRRLVLERQMEREFESVTDLARRIGLRPSTVYRWLRGVGPGTKATTRRILAGLRVEFDEVHRKVQTAGGVGPQ